MFHGTIALEYKKSPSYMHEVTNCEVEEGQRVWIFLKAFFFLLS